MLQGPELPRDKQPSVRARDLERKLLTHVRHQPATASLDANWPEEAQPYGSRPA
jgi:hypothetical protein